MIQSINPTTGELLWEGQSAGQEDVNAAVAQSRKAFAAWRNTSIEEREALLLSYCELLKSNQDRLARTISEEMGKPLWESQTEVGAMIGKVKTSIKAQQERCGKKTEDFGDFQASTRHKPLGVCAVFGPYNFPGHLPNGHIVPALLAGNTVVLKPSELTPLISEVVVELWKEAGLPEGVITLLQGGAKTGQLLSRHPDLNALFFTGSWRTGKLLASQFGNTPDKLLALEMGGNNPLVLGEINDLEAAVYAIIQSAFLTSGQRCTCARRLILQEQHRPIVENLLERIPEIQIGSYDQTPQPFMGPVVSNDTASHLLKVQENLVQQGAVPLMLMKRKNADTPFLSPGILDITNMTNVPDEEIFGPLLQIHYVDNFEESLQEANRTAYGLAASLLSDDPEQYRQFYHEVRAGVINWNRPTTGASSSAPFGGIGQSGNYRPSAYYAADYCNYPVASLESQKLTLPQTLTPGITL